MSERKFIPFRESFRAVIASGVKTKTSRSKKYAEQCDVVDSPFGLLSIDNVYEKTLGYVREWLWDAEGCASPEDFERVWRSLHRGHFDPDRSVWVHTFHTLGPW